MNSNGPASVDDASVDDDAPAELLLRAAPPRAQRDLLIRPRLMLDAGRFRGAPAILLQAPAGYGKTSLLAQWRRESLGVGAIVPWLTASPEDDPRLLLRGLVVAFRAAAGRPSFGHSILASAQSDPVESITKWLAEIARTALDTVLVVDEADSLPSESFAALAYVLRNLPPNLRALIGMRGESGRELDDLVAYGQCATVGPQDLRFDASESIELVRLRFGADFDSNAAVRLHEMADGWPLGIQLMLAVMASGREPRAAAEGLLQQKGRCGAGSFRSSSPISIPRISSS